MHGSDAASDPGAWDRARGRLRGVQRLLLCAGGGAIALYALSVGVVLLLSLPGPRVMLPEGLGRLILVGFVCLMSGAVLAVVTMRRAWLLFPVPALAFAPRALVAAFAPLVLETIGRPASELDRATLPDGRVVMLGMDPAPTDRVFSLWFADGLGWRPAFPRSDANSITYSEDGSFTANPRLVLAPDSRRLLVRRGGIWTDCFEIGAGLKPCPGIPRAGSVSFRARSAEIERLVYSPE